MKSDVLDSFDTIKACVAYKINGEETDEFPEEFNAYVSFLEEELGVPVKIVSVGPDREQTIIRYED